MSQRARYILIIVILLVVIGAGGGLIYYFTRGGGSQLATGAFITTEGGVEIIDRDAQIDAQGGQRRLTGDRDIDWLHGCTTAHNPADPSAYDGQSGTGFTIEYTCTNGDTSVPHQLEVRTFNAEAYVFQIPGEQCRDDTTKSTQTNGTTWPDAISTQKFPTYRDLARWMSQWSVPESNPTRNKSCQDLGSATNIQRLGYPDTPDRSQTITVPQGAATFSITTTHQFPTCEWWQYDDLLVDPTNQDHELIMGAPRRAAGQIGSSTCPAPSAPDVGNLEVRIFEDVDGNKEYSTPTAGGTDNGFFGQTVQITNAAGQDVTSLCNQGNTTGGAGRVTCNQIPIGQYTVQISNPDPVLYQGPIVDSAANPQPGEQHNATGSETLTLTVVPGPIPQGFGNDIFTFFDFGYNSKAISTDVGNLEVRVYEDADEDGEYSTPAAGGTDNPFPFHPVTVTNAAGVDITAQGQCNQGTATGGAGRLDCWQVPTGKYTVTIANPDATKYAGPIVDSAPNPQPGEQHNAKGTETLTLTVVAGPTPQGVGNDIITFYDFGYTPKKAGPIVVGTTQECTVQKSVSDQSDSDEENPDDPHRSVSSAGEQLDFVIDFSCNTSGNSGVIAQGTSVLITDEYDALLTTPTAGSISTGGTHDTTQNTISWSLQPGDSAVGQVSFSADIDAGLAAGTYSSVNKVSISRNNELENEDETVTSITVGTETVPEPVPPTQGGTTTTTGGTAAGTATSVRTGQTTPTTGVEANVAILLVSLLAAGAITGYGMMKLKPAYRKR